MNSDENSSAAKTKNTGGVLLNRAASGAPVVRKGAGVPVFSTRPTSTTDGRT